MASASINLSHDDGEINADVLWLDDGRPFIRAALTSEISLMLPMGPLGTRMAREFAAALLSAADKAEQPQAQADPVPVTA